MGCSCKRKYTVADGRPTIPPSAVKFDISEYHVISGIAFAQIILDQALINLKYPFNPDYEGFRWALFSIVYPVMSVLGMFSAVVRYARNVKIERDEVFEQELYVQKKNSLHAIGGDSDDEDIEVQEAR